MNPDSKVHGTDMGPTWVLSATDGPHIGPWTLLSELVFAVFGDNGHAEFGSLLLVSISHILTRILLLIYFGQTTDQFVAWIYNYICYNSEWDYLHM